ncbi:MAG TPA: iron-sulfur cluster assembly scaffold protein [Steroidobacter sp.]|nr:iron-sulfur cluster assembly scaffold protein [Steroidobacteraceae bacterium]HLS82222.1 iron-sulfur cluster assembly scaffold protein [Steroidobacter sp.]
MSTGQYSASVVEHFGRPHNPGRLPEGPDVLYGTAGDESHGARFALSARIAAGRIAEARFEAYGCPHCIAAASWLTTRLTGAALEDLERWSWREAATALDVPAEKRGRLLILEDAVRALARAWRDLGELRA